MVVGDAYVFPGFLTPVLTQLFFPKPLTTFLTCFCRGERRKYAGKKSCLNRGLTKLRKGSMLNFRTIINLSQTTNSMLKFLHDNNDDDDNTDDMKAIAILQVFSKNSNLKMKESSPER